MDQNIHNMAVEFANKQAALRSMTPGEYAQLIADTEVELSKQATAPEGTGQGVTPCGNPKAAIKEKSITCMVCGKSFRVITARHLELHGMTPAQYREFCGYPPKTALTAKDLQRERRQRMQGMKLWERRDASKAASAKTETPAPVKAPEAAKPAPAPKPATPAAKA